MLDKIHIFISVFAGIVIAIFSIIQKVAPSFIIIRLVVVITVFLIIGLFVRSYLNHIFLKKDVVLEEEPNKDLSKDASGNDNKIGDKIKDEVDWNK